MVRKQSVSRSFKRLSAANKVVFFLKVYNKMSATGSPFINPSLIYAYSLGLIKINAITTALDALALGGKGTADAVTKAVTAAEEFIDYWANIVDLLAIGNSIIIVSSGFNATKGTTTPGSINAQPTLDYKPLKQAGSVELITTGITVKNPTVTYVFGSNLDTLTRSGDLIYCTDTTIQLLLINSGNKKNVTVTGLPTNVDMQCVCVVTNTAGTSIVSNVIKFRVP